MLFRENIDVLKIDVGEKIFFEFLEWSLNINLFCVRLLIIYCLFYFNLYLVFLKMFFDEFVLYMESIILILELFIIMGDFNIYVNNVNDFDVCEFLDLLVLFGLK